MAEAENPELQMVLTWVPGHCGIEGNEITDTESKKAATNSAVAKPFNHKPLKSASTQA